jgi:hypothetical protein
MGPTFAQRKKSTIWVDLVPRGEVAIIFLISGSRKGPD